MGCRVWVFCCLLTVYLQRCSCRLLAAFVSSEGFSLVLPLWWWRDETIRSAPRQPHSWMKNCFFFFFLCGPPFTESLNVNFPERCLFSECTASLGCSAMRFSSTSADTTHCFQRKETSFAAGMWEQDRSRRGSRVLPVPHLHLRRFLSRPGTTLWQQSACVYAFGGSRCLCVSVWKKKTTEWSLISNSAGLKIPQKGNLI